MIRQDPNDARGPPTDRVPSVLFFHPANDTAFLFLPAYDPVLESPGLFGIHLRTALVACQILTYNKPGYFTTTRERTGPITGSPDHVILPGDYYYHLETQGDNPLYPICCDFRRWTFPHRAVPPEWVPNTPPLDIEPCNWTMLSERITVRDRRCRVTGWRVALNTAHVVPKAEEQWLTRNRFYVYLADPPLNEDPRNLSTLRCDLHLLFDQANFVIVPKCGQLAIHFLRRGFEAANLYHNLKFDHEDTLLNRLLYARFAWALCKIVKNIRLPEPLFDFGERDNGTGGDGSKGEGGKKRKRDQADSRSNDASEASGSEGGQSGIPGGLSVQECCEHEILSDEASERSIDSEDLAKTQQIQKIFPGLFDGSCPAKPDEYEDIIWYPGIAAVERRKRAYIRHHPQIRAHSGLLLPNDYHMGGD